MKRIKTRLALVATVLIATNAYAAEISGLETVTEFTDYRGAGVAVTPVGRIFVSMHPLDAPKYRVVEVMANGSKQPFPTTDWADGPEIGAVGFSAVLGIHSDSKGIVWMLDMGGDKGPVQIVAWDTVNNALFKQINIGPDALLDNSFPQDFAVDEARQKIYIADMTFGNFNGATRPAFIVLDLKTGRARRVLGGSNSLMPLDQDVIINGVLLASKSDDGVRTKIRFGLNPIALDDKGQWLYFGSLTGTMVYRIPASALADSNQSDTELASLIEEFGPKHPSDGMVMAPGGGVLVTDLQNSAVGLTTKDHYQTLVQDKQLSWPDSMAVNDGWVYVTQDQLHLHPAFSAGSANAQPPYKLMRFYYQP